MIIKADKKTCFVFDLDDTLYSEYDFLKSGYKYLAGQISPESSLVLYDEMLRIYESGGNCFDFLIRNFPEKKLSIDFLLDTYRCHIPKIKLRNGVLNMLTEIKCRNSVTGIITNGRSLTQRNKIKSLGLESIIDVIVISEEIGCEKPDEIIYKPFVKLGSDIKFHYFGDNLMNDFVTPRRLGWICVGILNRENIHTKSIFETNLQYLPHIFIKEFSEIEII